jgi:hypothetical protein
MIIAFYKPHEDKDCQTEIVKFVDRIWMDKSGNLKCIRTVIIHVNEDSPPLHGLRMLIPFRQIQELYNISETCLQDDYFLNAPIICKAGYNIQHFDAESYGSVSYDYFIAEVYSTSLIKSFDSPSEPICKIMAIDFKQHPVMPGKYRLIRITFKITSVLDEMFPKVYSLKLNYFQNNLFLENYRRLDINTLEIPTIKLLDKKTLQGGFDIFLYLPEGFIGTKFNDFAMTSSRQLPDGTRTQKPFQKFIWRGRSLFPDDSIQYLKSGDTAFSVEGLLADPYELENLRLDINQLKDDSCTLKYGLGKAKRNSIIAIIIASFFGLVGIFRQYIGELLIKIFK